MQLFNNNDRLQDLTMYSLDWAVYLRHSLEGPITPFLLLQKEDQLLVRVLVTDGNPMEYAKQVLVKEEKPFDQFVLGFEGYISDDQKGTGRTDALIVQGFDITQDKGVSLAQAFIPKEKGEFKKIDKVQFIGNPDLPREKVAVAQPDYTVEELGFSGIQLKKENLTSFVAVFTHKNPSVISNGMKRYLRGKLTGPESDQCNGEFKLTITPDSGNTDFLKYTILSALEIELQSELVYNWEKTMGRKVTITCQYGDDVWMNAPGGHSANQIQPDTVVQSGNKEQDNEKLKSRYENFSEKELVQEFQRIAAIPDARTNTTALVQMSALMTAFKEKGIALPVTQEAPPDQKTTNSNTIKIFLVLLVIIILYFVFRK